MFAIDNHLHSGQKGSLFCLEKVPGNVSIHKLRVIILLEADFNALDEIIFDIRLMPTLEIRDEIQV